MNIEDLPFNFSYLIKELQKRQINIKFIEGTDIVEASYQGHVEWLLPGFNRLVPANYHWLIHDKYYLKKLLQAKNFSVQEGKVFQKYMEREALQYIYEVLQFPVVVKATNLSKGDYVFVNIKDEEEFTGLWQENIQTSPIPYFLVEKYFSPPDDYTFFVMKNLKPVVVKRSPPTVIGDGKKMIQELIEEENNRRLNPRTTCLGEIFIEDFDGKRALKHQSLDLNSILSKGQTVQLRYNSNITYGGFCENVTEEVHTSYKVLAKSLLELFPGLSYVFVDLFSKDISQPVSEGMYAINEMTTALSISMFTMLPKGKNINILQPILDLLFPETRQHKSLSS